MAITMRIGLEKDFIPERMSVGELAISTDTGLMRYCHGPNKIKLIATDEDIAEMRKMVNDFDLTVQQALADIGNLGQSQTERVNTAGNTQTQRVNTAGDTQVSRVQAEGTTQVQNVQATAAEIAADREQIHTNRDNVAQLQRNSAGAITRSAEGSFITLEDAADGMGFRQLEIPGMTEQRTTTGAQLLQYDGDIVANNGHIDIQLPADISPGEYTLSCEKITGQSNKLLVVLSDGSTIVHQFYLSATILSKSLIIDKKVNKLFFYSGEDYATSAGKTATYSNVMLNQGATALPWEPYTGAAPSPSPEYPQSLDNVGKLNQAGKYEVKVATCGKNLLDMTGAKGGTDVGITTTVNPDGTFTSNGTVTSAAINIWLLGGYFPDFTDKDVLMVLAPGKTYCMADVVLFMGTENTGAQIFFIDPEKYPEGFKVTGVRHPQKSVGTVLTNKKHYPRVILGDTDTGWEPYRGHTATITSDRPLTKWDKLTCRDGVWGWAYGGATTVLNGTEQWSYWPYQASEGYYVSLMPINNIDPEKHTIWSSYFMYDKIVGQKEGMYVDNNTLHLTTKTSTASSVNELKAWLANHRPALQYRLAEEEWLPLTAEEQATMNALCTYAGTTHIWTDDPLQPVISVDYTLDTEGYIRVTAPAYRDVAKFALTGEASGTVATCTDSAEWPLLGIGMLGKCEQLATTGAQLFDSTTAKDGYYVSDTTGSEISGAADKFSSDYIPVATMRSITFDKKTAYGAWYNAQKQFISGFASAGPRTLTAPENAVYMRFTGYLDNKNIMVNAGETALPWEPYTGAAPSPSPAYKQEIQETGTYNPETGTYEADMVMTGAQLFDQTTVTKQSYVNDVTGKIGSTAEDVNASDYISVMGYEYIKITSTMKTKQWGAFYDTNKTFLSGIVGYDKPIPVPPDASYARLTVIGDNLKKFMVNAGATALPWEPYKGVQTLPLTADQPWRGIGDIHDEVCDRDGVLGTLRRFAEDILDGSEDEKWEITDCSDSAHKRFCSGLIRPKTKPAALNAGVEPLLCNAYKAISANDTYSKSQGISVEATGKIPIYDNTFSPTADLSGFKTYLAEYPITVVYQLKEPYFEPFPDEIQKQYRKLKSYAGTTHAWADDPLQPEVSFRYVKDSKAVIKNLQLDIAEQITDLQAQIDQLTINNNL